ncbi:hypothetical protein [Egbenema bharatensis]
MGKDEGGTFKEEKMQDKRERMQGCSFWLPWFACLQGQFKSPVDQRE